MSTEIVSRLLDEKFPGHGGRRKAATAIGISETYLSILLSGKRPLSLAKYKMFSELLATPLATLVGDSQPEPEPEPETYTVPVRGTVSAGKGIDREAERGETMPVPFRMRHADSLYRVRGTSMVAAGIDDGDIIGVRDAADADHGEIVVAWLEEQGSCVVKMLEHRIDGMAWLRGVNGAPQKAIRLREKDQILGVYCGKIPAAPKPEKKAKGKK